MSTYILAQPDDEGTCCGCEEKTSPCDPCELGACCIGTECSETTETDCLEQEGIWQGADTTCDPNPCEEAATGACCAPDGSCSITTESDCGIAGGTYQGDDTDCDPNPCPPPSGFTCGIFAIKSLTGIAEPCGYPEFGTPSDPPKYYLTKTMVGNTTRTEQYGTVTKVEPDDFTWIYTKAIEDGICVEHRHCTGGGVATQDDTDPAYCEGAGIHATATLAYDYTDCDPQEEFYCCYDQEGLATCDEFYSVFLETRTAPLLLDGGGTSFYNSCADPPEWQAFTPTDTTTASGEFSCVQGDVTSDFNVVVTLTDEETLHDMLKHLECDKETCTPDPEDPACLPCGNCLDYGAGSKYSDPATPEDCIQAGGSGSAWRATSLIDDSQSSIFGVDMTGLTVDVNYILTLTFGRCDMSEVGVCDPDTTTYFTRDILFQAENTRELLVKEKDRCEVGAYFCPISPTPLMTENATLEVPAIEGSMTWIASCSVEEAI